jgi:hypothetical protein
MEKLTPKQIEKIKAIFEKDVRKKYLAIQGHLTTLTDIAYELGLGVNYSIIQRNLKYII